MPGSPARALDDRKNVSVARTPSQPKRKYADGVGDNHEDPARQKEHKSTESDEHTVTGLQFGNLPPVDTADDTAAEKGITRVREGEDADRDEDGAPALRGEHKEANERKGTEAESNEMADGKADGMVVDEKDADGVSAGGVSEDADRGKVGGLTPDELVKTPEEMAIEAEAKRSEEAVGKTDGMVVEESANGAGVADGADGVDTEAEDSARRGGAIDSLNSLKSSSGMEGVSSSGSAGSAGPALDPALDKKDEDVADVAHGSDDDEVIHRGRGRRKLVLGSDDEGSAVESGGKTGGKPTEEGVESDDIMEDTDNEAESASHADHAGHCATLNIAHNASKNEIKEAYKLALQHDPGDEEGASERFLKVEEAKLFLMKTIRNAFRMSDHKEKAMAAAMLAARKAQKAEEASGVESGGKTGVESGGKTGDKTTEEGVESDGIKDAVATPGVTRHSPHAKSVANGLTRERGRNEKKARKAVARKAAARKVAEADGLAFDFEGWVDPGDSDSEACATRTRTACTTRTRTRTAWMTRMARARRAQQARRATARRTARRTDRTTRWRRRAVRRSTSRSTRRGRRPTRMAWMA